MIIFCCHLPLFPVSASWWQALLMMVSFLNQFFVVQPLSLLFCLLTFAFHPSLDVLPTIAFAARSSLVLVFSSLSSSWLSLVRSCKKYQPDFIFFFYWGPWEVYCTRYQVAFYFVKAYYIAKWCIKSPKKKKRKNTEDYNFWVSS